MIRGIYTAATGMGIQQLKQETITNNLANASTVGFKKDTAIIESFPDALLAKLPQEIGKTENSFIGKSNFGALIGSVVTNFSNGTIEQTDNPTHMALSGEGFFVVDTPDGERYTRDGNFTLDSEGYLVTQSGYRVVSNEGYILAQDGELSIDEKGQIFVDGEPNGKLVISKIDNPETLNKTGQNLFSASDKTQITDSDKFSLHQKYLEKPNLNLVEEMIELMTITRAYEANQKLIQVHDQILGKSVNEVGSIK